MHPDWTNVGRRGAPRECPICRRRDWCSVHRDGTVVACRRVSVGGKEKVDGAGVTFYLHRLDGRPLERQHEAAPPPPTVELASVDTRTEVYNFLLALLRLEPRHEEQLAARGLYRDEVHAAAFRSLPRVGRGRVARELVERFGPERLRHVPGVAYREDTRGGYWTITGSTGLLIPVRDVLRRVVALRVRADEVRPGEGKYRWLSSAHFDGPGPGVACHVPVGTPERAPRVRVVEGELKAEVAFRATGVPTISVPGVAAWRPALDVLEQLRAAAVVIAFDADCDVNPLVARALAEFVAGAKATGRRVELERWPAGEAKGLDDLLLRGGEPRLLRGAEVDDEIVDVMRSAERHRRQAAAAAAGGGR